MLELQGGSGIGTQIEPLLADVQRDREETIRELPIGLCLRFGYEPLEEKDQLVRDACRMGAIGIDEGPERLNAIRLTNEMDYAQLG
jgi:hypothetical protein